MSLTIRHNETQRAFAERVLRTEGRLSAHEAMFALATESGERRSITRLAPVIETLRKSGWRIRTEWAHGEQAVYHLEAAPPVFGRAVGSVRECPSCRRAHAVGTSCASAAVPA